VSPRRNAAALLRGRQRGVNGVGLMEGLGAAASRAGGSSFQGPKYDAKERGDKYGRPAMVPGPATTERCGHGRLTRRLVLQAPNDGRVTFVPVLGEAR